LDQTSGRQTASQHHHAMPFTGLIDPPQQLVIEHVVTIDDPCDGAPVLPGYTNEQIFWALVTPLPGGCHLWRRLYLQHTGDTS
jgi:hypothetical protein